MNFSYIETKHLGGDVMYVLLFMSVFWTIYGIVGLFGYQRIPKNFHGYSWTKQYIRMNGISWLMMGVPLLALYAVVKIFFEEASLSAPLITCIVMLLSLPAIIYTFINEGKYEKLLVEGSEKTKSSQN